MDAGASWGWRDEIHTFHLPLGEMTISLQDAGLLMGLPIQFDAVTGKEVENIVRVFAWLYLGLFQIALRPTLWRQGNGFNAV